MRRGPTRRYGRQFMRNNSFAAAVFAFDAREGQTKTANVGGLKLSVFLHSKTSQRNSHLKRFACGRSVC